MRIGIISFAHMHAHSYAKALTSYPNVDFVGIADIVRERGEQAANQYNTNYFSSVSGLLDQQLDGVIITSENVRHYQDVIEASSKGVHILCEKPLALSVRESKEMIEACSQNGVFLQVAFPVRFNTSVVRAKNMLDNGELGEILAIRGTNRGTNPGGWFVEKDKSGGGAVMDHTVHLVDIIRWFTGSEITEVYAESGRYFSNYETEDAGIITIGLENGAFATIDCSWSRNRNYPTWGDVTLEIITVNGTLSIDAFGQMINVYSNQSGVKWDYWGDDMDEGLVHDFLKTVKNCTVPSITGIDGLRAVEAVEAAYKSIKVKQPIRIR